MPTGGLIASSEPENPFDGQWYINLNGKTEGPFTGHEIRQMILHRELAPSDLVYSSRERQWVQAKYDPILGALFQKPHVERLVPVISQDFSRERFRLDSRQEKQFDKRAKGGRWLSLLCIFAALWLVWPYYALYSFYGAIRSGDAINLERYVAWSSLREGLRGDLNAMLLEQLKSDKPDMASGLTALIGPALINQMVDGYVTPQAIANLLRTGRPGQSGESNISTNVKGASAQGDLEPQRLDLKRFRYAFFSEDPITFKVEISPPNNSKGDPITLLWKWSGSWKLTRIFLPADTFTNKAIAQASVLDPSIGASNNNAAPAQSVKETKPEPGVLSKLDFDGKNPSTLRFQNLSIDLASKAIPGEDGRIAFAKGYYGGKQVFSVQFDDAKSDEPRVNVRLIRLDPSTSIPQVTFTAFSGGAHCCATMWIVTNTPDGNWSTINTGQMDADGYEFMDLLQDGRSELVGVDNSFFYTFCAYACSNAPTRIKTLVGTQLKDVTSDNRYFSFLRERLQNMEVSARSEGQLQSNGYLAAWVAAKAELGELVPAWRIMLVSYDRNSDWPLERCTNALPINDCPPNLKQKLSFPDALLSHLMVNGYISESDRTKIASKNMDSTTLPTASILADRSAQLGAGSGAVVWGQLFKTQVDRCWRKPYRSLGEQTPHEGFVVRLKLDGTFDGIPVPQKVATTPYLKLYQESALRALIQCQPYKLPLAQYGEWRYFSPVFTEAGK